MKQKLIVSQIQTPDGTILRSNSVHDYVTHLDKNGEFYMLDGGTEYQRISVNVIPCKNISIYDNSPFEEIRKYYCRGGRGKNNDEPLKWVPLIEMSDDWLKNCIIYNDKKGLAKSFSTYMYCKELRFRQNLGLEIDDIEKEIMKIKENLKYQFNNGIMSKELFVEAIEVINKKFEYNYECNKVFEKIFEDGSGYPNDFFIVKFLLDFLNRIFDQDKEYSDIDYFIYELDFGKRWTEHSLTQNGVSIDISTSEKLYDYLVSNLR